jgi:transposase
VCRDYLGFSCAFSTNAGRQRHRRVVVIIDNAKYHHRTLHRDCRQEHERSFQLDYLPAYSPDLNPLERV